MSRYNEKRAEVEKRCVSSIKGVAGTSGYLLEQPLDGNPLHQMLPVSALPRPNYTGAHT
jgi:hypothetical protein